MNQSASEAKQHVCYKSTSLFNKMKTNILGETRIKTFGKFQISNGYLSL